MAAGAAVPKPNQADAYLSAQEQFYSIINQLRSDQALRMTHSEVEQIIEVEGRELLRRMLQGHLDERSPGEVSEPVVDCEGNTHTHCRVHSRSLKSIFGLVTIVREGYGGLGLESLHPLDAELNLPPEIYSHTLQRMVAETIAKESYDETIDSTSNRTGVMVSKRQAEESAKRSAQDFDFFYEEQRAASASEVKATSEILVISVDGKGVPMRKSDLREATRKAAEERKPRLIHRRSKGEKSKSKRMGTVAAVYTIEPFVRTPEQIVREFQPVHEPTPVRPRPEDKRVWASVKHPPEAIIDQAFEEAERRDPKHKKQCVALVDGNETQLALLEVAAQYYGIKLTIILDIVHVLGYLWSAAWVLHKEGDPAAQAWVSKRLLEILRGRSSQVAAGMTRSATLRGLSARQRAPIDRCANYLLKYSDFLHYDEYLAAGYPIATGVIEGACRYLVKDRMEITGARWSLEGAEAVLRLRALRASGDFDEYWQFHLQQEYQRNHASHYAGGNAPPPNPPRHQVKGSHLRCVK
jgi:hypothetical protein